MAKPLRRRVAASLRSAIAPAFLASGLLHAVVLSWGAASGDSAAPAGPGALTLQVRLAERAPVTVASPVRQAPGSVPPKATSPVVATAGSPPQPKVRRLAIPAVGGVSLPPPVSSPAVPPVVADPSEPPPRQPVQAVAGVAPTRIAADRADSEAAQPDYQALLRAAAQRLQIYPERARRLGFEGTAVVAIERMPDQDSPRAVLVQSSGIGMLDRAALDLLERAAREVEPAMVPADQGLLRFPVRYTLRDGRD